MAALRALGMLPTDINELNNNDGGSVKSAESFLKIKGEKPSGAAQETLFHFSYSARNGCWRE